MVWYHGEIFEWYLISYLLCEMFLVIIPILLNKPMDESKPVCKICYCKVAVKGGNTTNFFSQFKLAFGTKDYTEA